jgi:hypothetical protein
MYLEILNDNMVGYTNISARDMLDHLFETYGNITTVDLEINFEHMRRDWDPQQPVESLFKQIQDFANYSESGGVIGYAFFATGHFMSACHHWNEKVTVEKLGHTSNRILQLLSANTNKCRDNLLPQPDTNQKMLSSIAMKIRSRNTPLEH